MVHETKLLSSLKLIVFTVYWPINLSFIMSPICAQIFRFLAIQFSYVVIFCSFPALWFSIFWPSGFGLTYQPGIDSARERLSIFFQSFKPREILWSLSNINLDFLESQIENFGSKCFVLYPRIFYPSNFHKSIFEHTFKQTTLILHKRRHNCCVKLHHKAVEVLIIQ